MADTIKLKESGVTVSKEIYDDVLDIYDIDFHAIKKDEDLSFEKDNKTHTLKWDNDRFIISFSI